MAINAPKACSTAGCGKAHTNSHGHCDTHKANRHGWSQVSRHKRGYGTAWDKLRKIILNRDMQLCQPCRRKGFLAPAQAVDHIVAKANNGTDKESNLESICGPCHSTKAQQIDRLDCTVKRLRMALRWLIPPMPIPPDHNIKYRLKVNFSHVQNNGFFRE